MEAVHEFNESYVETAVSMSADGVLQLQHGVLLGAYRDLSIFAPSLESSPTNSWRSRVYGFFPINILEDCAGSGMLGTKKQLSCKLGIWIFGFRIRNFDQTVKQFHFESTNYITCRFHLNTKEY